MKLHWRVVLWIGGFVTGAMMVVADEILAMALYCKGCGYPFPIIGEFPIWRAWEITFTAILCSIIMSLIVFTRDVRLGKLPESSQNLTKSRIREDAV